MVGVTGGRAGYTMRRGRKRNARNDGALGPGAAKQVDLAGLQRRVLAYENGVSSLAKRVEEVKRHSESTWEWIRDEYDLLDSEIENGLSELNQAIAIPLKNKRKLALEEYRNQLDMIRRELDRMAEVHKREVEKQFDRIIENRNKNNKGLLTWRSWLRVKILHWFTLGLTTVLQPLNYIGFGVLLKKIFPKAADSQT